MIATLVALLAITYGTEPTVDEAAIELKTLLELPPKKRTAKQTQRLRNLWRSTKPLRTKHTWFEVLQVGDSILTFPGLIVAKEIYYDSATKEYTITTVTPAKSPEEDTWEREIVVSEDWVVLRRRKIKMNSR